MADVDSLSALEVSEEPVAAPKRRRGRPRKVDVEASTDVAVKGSTSQPKSAQEPQQETISDSGNGEQGIGEVKLRRRRGRPRKNETVDAEMNRLIVQAASSHLENPPSQQRPPRIQQQKECL